MARTTLREFSTAGKVAPVLDGLILTDGGGSVAVDVAARHLTALGGRSAGMNQDYAVSRRDSGSTSSAGYLELRSLDSTSPSPLVRCEIDWAGPVDLALHDEAGVQAACGIMHVHGRRSGTPTALHVDYASVTAGVLAAQGVLAALLAQRRGMNPGQVRTSVAQAALLAVSQYLAAATAPDEWVESYLPGGPPFLSADGVRFEIEVFHAEGWQRFWALLDTDAVPVARGWRPFQQRYATATCPLPPELHRAAAAHSFASVSAAATETGVSVLAVRGRDRRTTGLPPRSAGPWRITALPGHASGRLTPVRGALPLEGLTVVESCRRLQGPLAGHLLGLLGAQVIRVEPPGGDPLRGVPPMAGDCSARFLALNRGKQVVELDLKSAAGRRSLRELVAGADVFLHNWAPGKAGQWDLDAERLCAVRPGLVYAWASGWGETLGPTPPLGTDFLVQAHSGLAALVGPDDVAPAPSLMTLTDVLGGVVCAQGVLAGLLARARTGRGQRVDSSLLSAATVLLQQPIRRRLAGPPGVPICTDLTSLAADPRFAAAVQHDGSTFPRAPWEFTE